MKQGTPEHSWINFKLDRKLHSRFSVIVRHKGQPLRTVMEEMVAQYVKDHTDELLQAIQDDV